MPNAIRYDVIHFAVTNPLDMESIKLLLSRIGALEQRLERLEKKLSELPGSSVPSPETAKVSGEVSVTAALSPQRSVLPPAFTAPLTPSHPPAATRPIFAQTDLLDNRTTNTNVEALIAGRWLHYVGILAVLFAVAFFLKYAFENNWIGPRGRVGIGLLIGSALFPWSHRLLERGYQYFSEGIAGLGAAVLYLSLWAGWHYYEVFSQSAAFALMIVVTIATATVSVGRNSERIAVLALIGGVLTPQLVSTGENHEVVLFSYLIVLGAAMLAIARVRDWKTLPPIQFLSTLVYFWGWYSDFYRDDELLVTMHRWGLTLAVVMLAAGHLAVERALPEKKGASSRIVRVLFAGLALTFVTLAIPIRLDGRWITIAWAIEGMLLICSGLRIQLSALRTGGFVLFATAAGRLALIPIPATQFLWNARFATFAVVVACFTAAYAFMKNSGVTLDATESTMFAVLGVVANVYALVAFSLEVWDVFGRMRSLDIDRGLAQQLVLSTLWLLYALGLMVAGIQRKSASVRWQALALLAVVIVKVFLFDLSSLDRFYRIMSFLLLGVVLLLISFFYQRRPVGQGSERGS